MSEYKIINANWHKAPKNYTGGIRWPNGGIHYVKNGILHREDGPAKISVNNKLHFYYLNGQSLTFKQFWERQKDTKYASTILSIFLGKK